MKATRSIFACTLGALIALMIVSQAVDAQPGRMSPQGGTITNVTAGSGLTGGATSGPATVNVGQGSGLTVTTDDVQIDPTYTQRRVSGTCTAGNAIRVVNQDGTVTCEPAGTITGTGTTGTIVKWTGTSTQGDSIITELVGGISVVGDVNATDDFFGDAAIMTGSSSFGDNVSIDTFGVTAAATFNGSTTVGDFRGTQIAPTSITGTVNDWAPTGIATATTIVISASGSPQITGLTGGADGRRIRLLNDSGSNVQLLHNSGLSLVGNRFGLTGFGGIRTMVGNQGCAVDLEYRGTFWYEVGFSCQSNIEFGKVFANNEFRAMSTASFYGASNTFGDATTDSFAFVGNTTLGDTRGASITPTDVGTQNDYNPTGLAGARVIYLNPASTLTITGLQGGTDGRMLTVCNKSTSQITLSQEGGTSTAANRFRLPGALSTNIPATGYWSANGYECVNLLYDGGISRWTVSAWSLTSVPRFEATTLLYAATQFTSAGASSFIGNVTSNGNWTLGNDAADTVTVSGDLTVVDTVALNGASNTVGDADSDFLNARGTLAFSGTDPTINACGTGASVSGEAQSFQVTVGTVATSCVINFGRTFNSAPFCVVTAANASASMDITPLEVSATTTTVTLVYDTSHGQIYNVFCPDRR